MSMKLSFLGPICLVTLILRAVPAQAELQPTDLVILANAKSPESVGVAQHYAAVRRIPPDRIVSLDLPLRDNLTRQEYDDLVVGPLRHTLTERNLASSVRVIVTTYGIPLRIEAPELSRDEEIGLAEARSWVKASRATLEHLLNAFEQMASSTPPSDRLANPPAQNLLEMGRTASLVSRVDQAWHTAVQHTQRLPPGEAERVLPELVRLTQEFGGWGLLIQKREVSGQPAQPLDTPQVAAWRALLEQTQPLWIALGRTPLRSQRPLLYRWAERLFGVRGVLELASAEVDRLTYTDADASLDSELSLLWWDRDLYSPAWRWPNPLYEHALVNPDDPPTLMVSRLDAPSPEIANRLVDLAVQTEGTGLHGTIYFDARGLAPTSATDTYGLYDQSLREAAALARARSSYPVVLDNAEPTMTALPDVGLYIGWYRLRSYDDVFTFRPGAIGYHMASAEAVTVHDRNERGWCKNALERGITATLGSVGEPYLDAFPDPKRFTELLLAGKYSLAEVSYLTSRYVSWRMVLFGDPLYTPMRGRSPIVDHSSPPLPIPLSERRLGDPDAQRARAIRLQRDRMAKLVAILTRAEQAAHPLPHR
jgi:uncharacterized protein (TIGR03790 family)